MRRWIWFLLFMVLGIGVGLLYGWVIDPVRYVDTTLARLDSDFQTDYVLMVAEAYQAEGDLDIAARRLAILGDSPPAEIVRLGMIYTAQNGWADSDQELLSQLASDLQTWVPAAGGTQP